jgi:hypothetical protein
MAKLQPGEICLVDLGLLAKVKPCLILSDYRADDKPALGGMPMYQYIVTT